MCVCKCVCMYVCVRVRERVRESESNNFIADQLCALLSPVAVSFPFLFFSQVFFPSPFLSTSFLLSHHFKLCIYLQAILLLRDDSSIEHVCSCGAVLLR